MLKFYNRTLFFVFISLVLSFHLAAQSLNLYSYDDLSAFSFAKQKDSLKKTWDCPQLYKDKSTQKKFREIWNERTDFITGAIDANNYINDGEIYNYIDAIISSLYKANSQLLKQKPLLLIDRSASVNAYALGGNVIAVNLGLVTFAESREELALAIAHELSHNILNHPENSMKQRAEWLTSDEYKNSLKSVLDSKYQRLTRLQKVIESYTFSRNRHSRYHESDADSLAIILLKNSHISFNPEFFLRLDSSDDEYRQPLKDPVKNYFASYHVPLDDDWFIQRSKGLSSHTYNFNSPTEIVDSLKTHPDCVERYEKTKSEITITGKLTPIPAEIKERANKMLIWNIYDNLSLTECLYRIFLEKDKGNIDPWYDFMTYNVLSGLYYSNKQLNRFNAIGIKSKEFISKSYYELQNLLEQVPASTLEELIKAGSKAPFWNNLPADAKGMKALFTSLNFDMDNAAKAQAAAANNFINSNPSSMYCEFAEHFKK
jgi:Zn-dependent protease with chaperone function